MPHVKKEKRPTCDVRRWGGRAVMDASPAGADRDSDYPPCGGIAERLEPQGPSTSRKSDTRVLYEPEVMIRESGVVVAFDSAERPVHDRTLPRRGACRPALPRVARTSCVERDARVIGRAREESRVMRGHQCFRPCA